MAFFTHALSRVSCVLLVAAVPFLTGCDQKTTDGKPGGLAGLLDRLKPKSETAAETNAPVGPLPPLVVQDIVEAEYPNFIDRPGKVCVLEIYDMYGPLTAEVHMQREHARQVEEEVAKYSDVAVLGRLDLQKCRMFSKSTGAPGVVGITLFVDGKEAANFGGTIGIEEFRNKLAAQADPQRAKLRAAAATAPGVPIPMREMAESEYPGLIAAPDKLAVVVYHAEWCGPCKALKPTLDLMTTEFPGLVVIGRFNVDNCRSLAGQNGVSGIPDVRFFLNGKEVDRFTGLAPAETVRAKFKQYTAGLKPAAPASPEPASKGTVTRMKKDWLPPGMEKQKR